MRMYPAMGRRARRAPFTLSALACATLGLALAFGQGAQPGRTAPGTAAKAPAAEKKKKDKEAAVKKEVAVIKTTMGTIVFEFLPDVAPKMVDNFKELANSGFYNGTTFHRVINGYMIQGGDPLSKDDNPNNDGTGSGPRKMPAEFTTKYSHTRGMVSTARSSDPNSGSCQFFIVQKDSKFLDNKYTIFGRVLEGMDVVDAISNVPKNRSDRPLKNVVMESVSVEER
jgi:peptidyl-prolyl cis-trans isomerase B (cyclophilin B)